MDSYLHIRTQGIEFPGVRISFPVIVQGTDFHAMQRMNEVIERNVHELMREQGFPQTTIIEMIGTFEVKCNERGVFSMTLDNYTFTGGAHGNTIQRGLTFETDRGNLVPLAGLFTQHADYVSVLSAEIKKQIEQRQLPLLEPFQPINPNQYYYIADKVLVIFYQLYELLPYVYGFPSFPISVYTVQDIVRENGPLGRMIP